MDTAAAVTLDKRGSVNHEKIVGQMATPAVRPAGEVAVRHRGDVADVPEGDVDVGINLLGEVRRDDDGLKPGDIVARLQFRA